MVGEVINGNQFLCGQVYYGLEFFVVSCVGYGAGGWGVFGEGEGAVVCGWVVEEEGVGGVALEERQPQARETGGGKREGI